MTYAKWPMVYDLCTISHDLWTMYNYQWWTAQHKSAQCNDIQLKQRRDRGTKKNKFLNPAISPKLRVAGFISTLWQSHDLHENQLTHKVELLEWKYFTGSIPSLTDPKNSSKTCDNPQTLTETTLLKKCGVKISWGGQENDIRSTHL